MNTSHSHKLAALAWTALACAALTSCSEAGADPEDAALEGGTRDTDAAVEDATLDAGTGDATSDVGDADEPGELDGSDPTHDASASESDAGDPTSDAGYDSGDATAQTDGSTEASMPSDAAGEDSRPPEDAGAIPDAGPDDAREPLGDAGSEPTDATADVDAADPDENFVCDMMFHAGHGDMYAAYVEYDDVAGLSLHVRSHLTYPSPGGTEPLHEPADVCVVVPASSRQRVVDQGGRPPAGYGFEAIGVDAGAPFWFLSNSNLGAEQPFWGVATEGVQPQDVISDIRFRFEEIETPPAGDLAVYHIAGIEPRFYVSTADPSATQSGAQEIVMPAGGHDHQNWSFTAPGHYAVGVVAEATGAEGQALRSPLQTYHFLVEE